MIDILSETWLDVLDSAEGELKKAQRKLENRNNDRDRDLVLKGEIKALRRIIALPELKRADTRPNGG